MQKIIIGKKDSNQTVVKFLKRYFPSAPQSLIYKQIRKKNIVVNDKKITGSETLKAGDVLSVYMSDETISKFRENSEAFVDTTEYIKAYKRFGEPEIVYEDEHIIILNKPVGILSQKSQNQDLSANEWLIGYLLESKKLSLADLSKFKPSVCNRLDRNTGGLILFGKTLFGTNTLNRLIKDRTVSKYYKTIVFGEFKDNLHIKGYLIKDEKNNKVKIFNDYVDGSELIETRFIPKRYNSKLNISELDVELITGKAHQIRAHLSSIDFPVIGDYKYGNVLLNDSLKRMFSLSSQFLYSYKLIFPALTDYPELSCKCFELDVNNLINKFFED